MPPNSTTLNNHAFWWESFAIGNQQCINFHLGQLSVMLASHQKEWTLAWRHDRSLQDPDSRVIVNHGEAPRHYDADMNMLRVARAHPDSELCVEPRLADRNIVARPSYPMTIAPGDSIDFFLSTPLWLTIKHQNSQYLYFDQPLLFLSDTWFGPNPLSGELCYATKTQCRLYLDDLPRRQTRAITPVRINNRMEQPFNIERINVPVPYLSLQHDKDGMLWTEQVVMTCSDDKHQPTSVSLSRDKVTLTGPTEPVSAARQAYARDSLKSMLALILN